MEVDDLVKCPECSSRRIIADSTRGERSCKDCGLVLADREIDVGPDWRSFDESDDKSHVGLPTSVLYQDKGLTTDIGWQNTDYLGKAITGKKRAQYHRMRKWQRRAKISGTKERNLKAALLEIDRVCGLLGLPKTVREEASMYYRRAIMEDLIRGRSIEAMSAASVYLANQKMGTARSIDDVVTKTKIKRKTLTRAYKTLKASLRVRIAPVDPSVYVGRYVSLLGLDSEVERTCLDLLSRAAARELTHGKTPTGIAASALYVSCRLCNQTRTQREIAEISGVTEVTIRNRYKELCRDLGVVLED